MSHQYYKFEMVTMDKLFWCAIRPNQKKKRGKNCQILYELVE